MRLSALMLVAVALTVAGCGKKSSRQVPVVGTVTLDGDPVGGALVVFMPTEDSPGQGGFARTGPDGKFEIKHELNGPGLVPGTYKVTVGGSPPMMDGQSGEPVPSKKVPGRYGDPMSTPLTHIKVEPGKSIDLAIASDPKK
jgi:hypothetical protein